MKAEWRAEGKKKKTRGNELVNVQHCLLCVVKTCEQYLLKNVSVISFVLNFTTYSSFVSRCDGFGVVYIYMLPSVHRSWTNTCTMCSDKGCTSSYQQVQVRVIMLSVSTECVSIDSMLSALQEMFKKN